MSNIELYTKFISEQVRKNNGIITEEHKHDGYWTHSVPSDEMHKHKTLNQAKKASGMEEYDDEGDPDQEETIIHLVKGGRIHSTHVYNGDEWVSHNKNKGKPIGSRNIDTDYHD